MFESCRAHHFIFDPEFRRQSYAYDGFGNLTNQTVTSGSAPALNTTYDPATNRQTGECADANGNINSATNCTNGNYFDMENRLVRSGGSPVAWAYSYAPGNKRVWRGVWSSGTQTADEVTFWSVSGQKLETYQLSQYKPWPGDDHTLPQLVASQTGTNYYFGGKLVKNSAGYVTPDRLGSIGKYFPYGQERPSATTDGKEKFATYFRDSETGLDYANNRYHQPGMGRFMTADPYAASGGPSDPGSWNRYAYTRGDPVNRADPGGTEDCPAGFNFCSNIPSQPIQSSVELPGTHQPPGGNGDPQCMILYLAAENNPDAEQMFEAYCTGEQVSQNTQPSRTPNPYQVTLEIPKAVVTALKLLDNPDCAAIFGIGYAQDGSTVTPSEVLLNLYMGGTYGSIVAGVPTVHPGQTVGAVTSDIATVRLSDVYAHGVTQILLNDTAGAFIDGSQQDQTIVLLHELGHAMNYIFGLGTNGFNQSDAGNVRLSRGNTDLVKKYCK